MMISFSRWAKRRKSAGPLVEAEQEIRWSGLLSVEIGQFYSRIVEESTLVLMTSTLLRTESEAGFRWLQSVSCEKQIDGFIER